MGGILTVEERRQAEALQEAVAKKGREQADELVRADRLSKAKYKLQVWIKSDRSVHKPLTFTLSFWESGKRLHGGGDESMWVCRRRPTAPIPKRPLGAAHRPKGRPAPTPDGCDRIIPGDHAVRGYVVCPSCGVKWDTEFIADALFYRVPVETAAAILADWYRRLDSDCDVYVKFRPEDVRVKMQARQFGLRKARQLKGQVIYPNSHIIRDCVSGATVESRFKALLLA